ncbi:MAG: class II aldolase/adducin family protein [Candidatus Aenigmarchaeota archaeon]|nr:class II aldolase/adducin family protein [Candidatus Aenigmarchaeota archaeon]
MPKNAIGNFTRTPIQGPLPYIDIKEIAEYRRELWNHELIGVLKKGQWTGYDYGNISFRMPMSSQEQKGVFLSCSQTSSKPEISMHDFALVIDYDSDKFEIRYIGAESPSSETPIHLSAYLADENIGAVIHGHIVNENYALDKNTPYFPPHVLDFFQKNKLPCTKLRSKTKESGDEIFRIVKDMRYVHTKDIPVIGMPNHDGGFGLIILGKDFKEAYDKTLEFYGNLLKFGKQL